MFKSEDGKLQIYIFQNINIIFFSVHLQKVRDAGQRLARVEALVSSYENGFYIEIPITFDTIHSAAGIKKQLKRKAEHFPSISG